MAAIGRILQVIGWLWFLAGIVDSAFGFDFLNPFPGLVLIFIARIFRTRARSEMPPGPADAQAEPQPEPLRAPRPQPRQAAPPPSQDKRPETGPSAEPRPEPKYERPVDERNDLLERIAAAGREAMAEPDVPEPERGPGSRKEESKPTDVGKKPMSSAEMIAQARKRWDRDKR
ncbi:MAG TPA: hypothetical protein VF148_10220 [Acidimicrobiia bacterium]